MKINKNLVAIDLFSGCGGLSLGLKQAGFDVRAAVEIDKSAILNYKNNINQDVVLEKRIEEITGKELLEKANVKKGELILLAGCPPCQGFSSQKRLEERLKDKRNELVFEFTRLVISTRPLFILMENVPGLNRGYGKTFLDTALEKLKRSYLIVYDILNAADYGVPQTRKRLVLHGIRKDIYMQYKKKNKDFVFGLPRPTHTNNPHENNNLLPWNTVRVIEDLPRIEAGEEYSGEIIKNHRSMKLSDKNLKRIEFIRANGGSRINLPENLQLTCHKEHKGHTDVYGIMEWDKPAPTITGGCLSYSKGRYGHPSQNRAISVREAARLQTFPDNYIFEGSLSSIATQIGNAVPVSLAKASGSYIKECYEKISESLKEEEKDVSGNKYGGSV